MKSMPPLTLQSLVGKRHGRRYALLLLALTTWACGPAPDTEPIRTETRAVGETLQDCPVCPMLVVIPGGRFTMGFDGGEPERYEGPLRQITISEPFAAGQFEVTVAQYRAFVERTGHRSESGCFVWDGQNAYFGETLSWRDPGFGRPPADDEPVVCVSWTDAKAYAAWLSEHTGEPYRLLSEAEWEYAARAGSPERYAWGSGAAEGCRWANMFDRSAAAANIESPLTATACEDGFARIASVGSLEPNAFKLYDTTGNVWEWVEDCYLMPYPPGPTDGNAYLGPAGCDRRGVRGGSWITGGGRQTVTFRGRDPEDRKSQIFGFRVARHITR